MNQWLQLLEALHSSWIDELIERNPNFGPELGVPTRHSEWKPPSRPELIVYESSFHLPKEDGYVYIATTPSLEAQAFWSSVLKRTEREFSRRRIAPVFSPLAPRNEVNSRRIRRLIWIPLSIRANPVFLGIGVCHG